MKKCPYCAEEIQDEAIKCKHCGESVVSLKWRDFCERFATLPEDRQYEEWTDLGDDEKLRFRSIWRALGHSGEYHPQAPRPVESSSNQGVPAISSAPASLKKPSDIRTSNFLRNLTLLVAVPSLIGLLFYVASELDFQHSDTQANLRRKIEEANVAKAEARMGAGREIVGGYVGYLYASRVANVRSAPDTGSSAV